MLHYYRPGHKLIMNKILCHLVMEFSSLSMASTNAGKFTSVRHKRMKVPSCSVGKLVSAYALPRGFCWDCSICNTKHNYSHYTVKPGH